MCAALIYTVIAVHFYEDQFAAKLLHTYSSQFYSQRMQASGPVRDMYASVLGIRPVYLTKCLIQIRASFRSGLALH